MEDISKKFIEKNKKIYYYLFIDISYNKKGINSDLLLIFCVTCYYTLVAWITLEKKNFSQYGTQTCH